MSFIPIQDPLKIVNECPSGNQRFQDGAINHQPSALSLMTFFFLVFADR